MPDKDLKMVEDFLLDFKKKNPNATPEEISRALWNHIFPQFKELEEAISPRQSVKNFLKIVIPAIVLVYGSQNAKSIVDATAKQAKTPEIQQVIQNPIFSAGKGLNAKIGKWILKYSKKYGIHPTNLLRLITRETEFSITNKNYRPNVVGDKGNTLGPSYGACQIKVATAKEIYTMFPESDVKPNSITAGKLQNDTEFNIRTAAKILAAHYKKFGDIKHPRDRMAMAATAYNAGYTGAKTHGVNRYGRTIAGLKN